MSENVSRAFDQPLTAPMSEAEYAESIEFTGVDATPLYYEVDPDTRAFSANPGYDDAAIKQVEGAIVKITGEGGEGSGFITTDERGNRVIVTAAHVVGERDPDSIVLTDISGNQTTASNGRYIIESRGQLQDALGNGLPQIDVAVLRPRQPIGATSLKIGNLAARGTWLDMVNYQSGAAFDSPYRYKAVALRSRPGISNYVLTGMEPERASESPKNYVIQPGASGGVVFNPHTKEVAGVSFFGGIVLLGDEGQKTVHAFFDRPTGEESAIYPLLAHITDPAHIHKIISALPYGEV
jgi:hypothetical protein